MMQMLPFCDRKRPALFALKRRISIQKKEKILLSVEALTLVWTLPIKKNRLKQVHT